MNGAVNGRKKQNPVHNKEWRITMIDATIGHGASDTPPVEVNRAVTEAYQSGYADGMRHALELLDKSRHEMSKWIASNKPNDGSSQ